MTEITDSSKLKNDIDEINDDLAVLMGHSDIEERNLLFKKAQLIQQITNKNSKSLRHNEENEKSL